MVRLTLPSPNGRISGYVRRCRDGTIEVRYLEDKMWHLPSRDTWETFTPDDLRAIAKAKEAKADD